MICNVTAKDLLDRSKEVGDCWIWQQALSPGGYPIMRPKGCQCVSVRRVAAEIAGHKLGHGEWVITTCGEKQCVNPDHAKPSTRKAAMQRSEKVKQVSSARRSILSQNARVKAKINMEIADQIRASDKKTLELANQYGIHASTVKRIRNGSAWKDYKNNPFVGLMP